jgi:hypothetical protein
MRVALPALLVLAVDGWRAASLLPDRLLTQR